MTAERATLRVERSGPRPLVTKTAHDGAAASRLAHELAVLRRAQHPGVVTLVDAAIDEAPDAGGIVVRTRFCGSRTLGTLGDLTVDRVAGLIAALATTVAELHDLGVAHGRLSPDHVLLAVDGRPVLCGFGEATLDPSDGDRADDVAALGVLLRDLVIDLDDGGPITTQSLSSRRGWSGYQRRALLNLADLATADDPARRPSAQQFAQQLRAAAPGATLDEATQDPSSPGPRRRERALPRVALIASTAVVVVGVAGMSLLWALPTDPGGQHQGRPTSTPSTTPDTPGPSPRDDVPPARSEPEPTPGESPSDRAATVSSRHPWELVSGCSTSPGGTPTKRNGSDCEGELSFESGNLTVGTETFEVDLVDAVAAVGRFSCDEPTAAVLDLASGGVFVFTSWARPDQPVSAERAGVVPTARRLIVEATDGERCDRLVVLDQFGIRHTVVPPSRGDR